MSDAPNAPLPADIQALENELRQHPNSVWHHSELLLAFCSSELQGHPRRIELVLDFISRYPHSIQARGPLVDVDPDEAPEAFNAIEALWSRLRNEQPADALLALGHAALVANQDRDRAAKILRETIALLPNDAELWTELGRVAPDPAEQLDALHQARALGSSQPNLLAWTGLAAVDAGRFDELLAVGLELAARASKARDTVSVPIPWEDTSKDAWRRIRATLEGAPDRELGFKLAQYANDTHWSHTFLGLVAAEQARLSEAGDQLLSSGRVWGEFRLSSYGPSFVLARKLCEAGMWKHVEQYLLCCKNFWDDSLLDAWLEDVRNQRMPDFDEQ